MADIEIRDYTVQIKRGFEKACARALREIVLDVVADAKMGITDQDAIDTGALRKSIYAETPGAPGYGAAAAAASAAARTRGAHSGRPNKNFEMLPAPEPVGALEAIAAVGAEYGVYVEFGTVHVPPAPFFGPAEEKATEVLDQVVARMVNEEVT